MWSGHNIGTRGYKEGHKEYMKDYWQRNPKKYMMHSSRKRARISNIENTITEEDFDIPEYCPILGIKLLGVRNSQKDKDAAPSLDRVDNSKGYIPGNVRVISFKANRYKNNMTKEQIEALYKYVISSTS